MIHPLFFATMALPFVKYYVALGKLNRRRLSASGLADLIYKPRFNYPQLGASASVKFSVPGREKNK